MTNSETPAPLPAFLPAVQIWFRETFGQPTPPQAMGWPAIQRGEHTLILSPTGSGKTLAAFLWSIDQLYRETGEHEQGDNGEREGPYEEGVRLLYVSPERLAGGGRDGFRRLLADCRPRFVGSDRRPPTPW